MTTNPFLSDGELVIIPGDMRAPVAGHLNYAADADIPSPLIPMGPTTMGASEMVYPVTVQRTEERLRIGFSYIAPSMSLLVDAYAEKLDELPPLERELVEQAVLRKAGMDAVLRHGA